MSIGEDRDNLGHELNELRDSLNDLDVPSLNEEEIEEWISKISHKDVSIKQFIAKYGENRWTDWGLTVWASIEHNLVALERKQEILDKEKQRQIRVFDRKVSLASLLFLAISSVAAAVSAYYSFHTVSEVETKTEAAQEITEIKAANKTLKQGASHGTAEKRAAP